MKFDKKEPNIKFRLKSTHIKFLQRIKKSILPTKKKIVKNQIKIKNGPRIKSTN